jgi:asparagine synthetase B (glutamine-hydrolysing)
VSNASSLDQVFLDHLTGREASDPAHLLDSARVISLRKLSLYFSAAALEREFIPDSPWQGIERLRPVVPWPTEESPGSQLYDRFHTSVRDCLGDAEVAVLSCSGGLDSLAVLVHADQICLKDGRDLHVCVVNMLDDIGQDAAQVVERFMRQHRISRPLHRFEWRPEELPEPDWHPLGPRPDSMPRFSRALNDFATGVSAGILLSGMGADELFSAQKFLTGRLLRRGRLRALRRYWADSVLYFGAFFAVGEGLGLCHRLFRPLNSFQMYQAFNWPVEMSPCQLLQPAYREFAEAWSRAWLFNRFELFRQQASWTLADAWDTMFPIDRIPPAGEIPDRTPFLEPEFATFAMGIPIESRYSHLGVVPYHRFKALVLELLRDVDQAALPTYKQMYGRAMEKYWRAVFPENGGLLTELGILQPVSTEDYFRDPRIPRLICALHYWIKGALDAGASIGE